MGIARVCLGLVLVLGGLPGRTAGAAELLQNGDFAEGTEFWTPIPFGGSPAPTIVYSLLDRGGSDESGSGEVTQSAAAGMFGDVGQCVGIAFENADFDLSGWVLISPENPNAMATARFRVVWYPTVDCSGGGSSVLSPGTTLQDQWIPLQLEEIVPVPGTQSARVQLEILLGVEGQPITVNYDDVEFLPEPTGSAALLASILGLFALRWRARRASGITFRAVRSVASD